MDPDATAAREIAEQILAKEPDNRTATMEREHQRERAASLATLVPMYRTATERAAEHHYEALIDRVGGTLLHLLRPHYPEAHLDTDTALTPAPVNAPANAAHPIATERSADRYRTELAGIFGAEPAEAVAAERAWPAVVGALRRAEEAVRLRRATAGDRATRLRRPRPGRTQPRMAHRTPDPPLAELSGDGVALMK